MSHYSARLRIKNGFEKRVCNSEETLKIYLKDDFDHTKQWLFECSIHSSISYDNLIVSYVNLIKACTTCDKPRLYANICLFEICSFCKKHNYNYHRFDSICKALQHIILFGEFNKNDNTALFEELTENSLSHLI